MTRAWRLGFAALYVLVLGAGLALGLDVMIAGYSPVPFADFWAQLPLVERGIDGDLAAGDLWEQWNEHRIPLARLQFIADYAVVDGTNVLLFGVIATSCVLLAAVFAAAIWLDTRDGVLALGTMAAASCATLSPAGIENLTWAFQVAFVQAFLYATVSMLAAVLAARAATPAWSAIATGACALAAAAATYSLANGVLVWPIVVVLVALLGAGRRVTAALAGAGVLTVGSFLWGFDASARGNLSDPFGLIHFVLVYLGSIVWGAGSSAAAVVGAAGLVLFAAVCALGWRVRSGRAVAAPFGAAVAPFIVLTAAQTAIGRLDLGVAQALSSRYSIASATFWLGLLVGVLPALRLRTARAVTPVVLAGAGALAVVVGFRMLPAESFLPTVVFGRELTVVAYRTGVEDRSQIPPVGQAGPGVRAALVWMEREELGPWAPGGMVDEMRVGNLGPPTQRCAGRVDAATPVDGGTRFEGWVDAPDGEATSRHGVVLDGSAARVGQALVGAYRPDARPLGASDVWRGFVAYAPSTSRSPLDLVLPDESRDRAVCSLRLREDG